MVQLFAWVVIQQIILNTTPLIKNVNAKTVFPCHNQQLTAFRSVGMGQISIYNAMTVTKSMRMDVLMNATYKITFNVFRTLLDYHHALSIKILQ